MKRRHLFQLAASTLTVLGLNRLQIQQQGHRYPRILAQTTPRKLALLVGINQYPNSFRFEKLLGSLTDVELQRELLVHRFGFKPQDIITLRDNFATREAILTAFEEHLIAQAKDGDVVMFHFSGHGSRIADPDPIHEDGLNSTLVPADDFLNGERDIMGRTLFLLATALSRKTENLTLLLDCCYSGGGTRGNIRIRAVPGGKEYKPSSLELETQERWRSRLNLSPEDFQQLRRKGFPAGVAIAAAQRNQEAAEYAFPDFEAGAFTFLLTQYLWQQTDTVAGSMSYLANSIRSLSPQTPFADGHGNKQPLYFPLQPSPPAEAVVTKIEGDKATLWLGGINRYSIEAFDRGATFRAINSNARATQTELELLERNGITAIARVQGPLSEGSLLQESSRVIPANWQLRVGLDPSLGTDILAAESKLSQLNRIFPVQPSKSADKLYDLDVHYILGRVEQGLKERSSLTELPPEGSIALFSPTLEPLAKSWGSSEESIDAAIDRLIPKLKALLAGRVVKLALNANSSRLKVSATMELLDNEQTLVAENLTLRGDEVDPVCSSRDRDALSLPSNRLSLDERFQFTITNYESRVLYCTILVLDTAGEITVLFPNQFQSNEQNRLLELTSLYPGKCRIIPDSSDEFNLRAKETGVGEVLIITSLNPLTQGVLKLKTLAAERERERGPQELDDPLDFVAALIEDFSNPRDSSPESDRTVSPTNLAALILSFQVI